MKTDDIDELNNKIPESRTKRELLKRRIARLVKRRLAALLAILGSLCGAVKFGLGEKYWPLWLVHSQNMVVGILLLLLVFFILLSPLIIEFSKDPRPLSGSNTPPYLHGS